MRRQAAKSIAPQPGLSTAPIAARTAAEPDVSLFGAIVMSFDWWHTHEVMARQTIRVTIGPQGRLVVPAPLRKRLGLEPGDVLVARADGDRLVLERRDAVLARVRTRLAAVPADVAMVDELIAERREEASGERADR